MDTQLLLTVEETIRQIFIKNCYDTLLLNEVLDYTTIKGTNGLFTNSYHKFYLHYYNKRLITVSEYRYLKLKQSYYGIERQSLRRIPHMGFSMGMPNGDYLVSFATSGEFTMLDNNLLIKNYKANNSYKFVNPCILMDNITYAIYLETENGCSVIPTSLAHLEDEVLINDLNRAFIRSYFTNTWDYDKILRLRNGRFFWEQQTSKKLYDQMVSNHNFRTSHLIRMFFKGE